MNALQTFIESCPCGFIKAADMPSLIALDRLCPVLVRCGGGRFTCPAQDVAHFIKCVEAGGDYVRDVSFPTGSLERAATWQPDCPVTPLAMLPASFTAPVKPKRKPVQDHRYYEPFNEGDCGGAYDGFSVSSDADSGL